MDRFEQALARVRIVLREEFGDRFIGLLAAGSVIYGVPMRNSDLDIYVLIDDDWRQRRNRVVAGVEVEMFINPVEQIRRELEVGEVPTVDMFARGRIVDDTGAAVAGLVELAKEAAAEGPPQPDATAIYFARYDPSDLVRDLEDLLDLDSEAAELLLHTALSAVLEARWRIRGRNPPKPKRLLSAFRDEASSLVSFVEVVLDGERDLTTRAAKLRELCDLVLQPVGGVMLEGETEPERVTTTG